jgi:sugar/nucleoside kinase (ribokinase family)
MPKTNSPYEILGVGTPLLDHLLHIQPEYLNQIGGAPHGMEPVSYEELFIIIENSGSIPLQMAGGSCCNAIKGLASLGHQCALTGKIGKEATGEKVLKDLQKKGITPLVCYSPLPTAHVVCLITPDGKRTCRSFLGAGADMRPDDLNPVDFQKTTLVHIEGYTLLTAGLTHQAMDYAKQSGARISFDLGSFEIVESYKELLTDLISKYVSILFANEDEVLALTGLEPEAGCKQLSELCDVAVVMMGKQGCWVGHQSGQEQYPAFPVEPIDTTGAGDLFASGFLHGILLDKPYSECARYGAITGGAVVQHIGAEIPADQWGEIKRRMER